MKNVFIIAVWSSFILGMLTLLNEFSFDRQLEFSLSKQLYGLPANSKTLELISSDKKYINSQLKALEKRTNRIPSEIFKHFCVLGSSLLFLNLIFRKSLQTVISSSIDILPKFRHSVRMKELLFISLISTFLLASVFGSKIFANIFSGESLTLAAILFYTFLGLFVLPTFYMILKKLFKVYSSKLIIACYMAYFVKAISDFVSLEDVNLENMKKVNISEFSKNVRDYLIERGLQNKVYSEKLKKSQSINAALVGWGSYERIEIYGDYQNLTSNEFEAILMHEIGHSEFCSLIKKILTLFFLKTIEMVVVLQIYASISNKFSDSLITKNGSFIVLFLIYFLFINRWLLMFHKMVSQVSEFSADTVAKSHGYGKELSKSTL
ncbi:uncharacterized protein VICG_00605 [Vittaforma corneae ATCC 50505]|uniref:Peptidase M48 domain-containing protein n=1 Tax=Vittaforma corneae (strain ATCC 50505) TaxID=993615 RepID=L2GNU0_VITCO|nr:uncharacterized protein VICG_00605 [Vittaforma corneae ATCC 50505]ELA42506.1 hypothetical protein VICG_00605 [Vittaforma corneae ATCC 50505]